MARCAVVEIETGKVQNIIVAAPTDEPPEGCMLVELPDQPSQGWYWNGEKFVKSLL